MTLTLLQLSAFEKAAVVRRNFPHVCSCGRRYTVKKWLRLPLLGEQTYPWGEVQEFRNCACGSTMVIVLREGVPEEGLGTAEPERRAPVQGDSTYTLGKTHPSRKPNAHPPGTVAWSEHEEAWREYARQYGTQQSAERIAERWGFSYGELVDLLGHEPTSWRPL